MSPARHTTGRILATATAISIVAGGVAVAGGSATAAPNPAPSMQSRTLMSLAESGLKPAFLNPTRQVRVMVTFSGQSVVERETASKAAGQVATASTKVRDRAAVRMSQETTLAQIRATGARVERRYSETLSGAAISAPASALATIAELPGVVAVSPVRGYERTNTRANNFTGASAAWTAYSTTGEGVKIAIIDSGIDYGHSDFGGPGTTSYYTSNDRTIIENTHPFPTAKVIGGYDFVGDAFDAGSSDPALNTPMPDADPLDCSDHGTHVAGTAAGVGVTQAGAPYTGPYTQSDVDSANLLVPPGSAPEASLLAYKVFGCTGTTDEAAMVAAVDRAVADGAQIISMSIGLGYGIASGPVSTAFSNATAAGVTVVVAAANDGHVPYLVGGASTSPAALSVAAMDAWDQSPGATLTAGATTLTLLDANLANPTLASTPITVLSDGAGGIGAGCTASDYASAAGKIVITKRGVCDRTDRAVLGQAAGAAAVIMVNSAPTYPPIEGPLSGVTIPFLGAAGVDEAALLALDTQSATAAPTAFVNPDFKHPASFTSSGPRSRDAGVKPEVIAPGVGILSARFASGFEPMLLSGTSMATPHVAGIAALVRAANPTWTAQQVKNAIANTASSDAAVLFNPAGQRLSGNGVAQPLNAFNASIQLQATRAGDTGLSFGVRESTTLDATSRIQVVNAGSTARNVTLTASASNGATLSVSPRQVRVRPGATSVQVRIRMSRSAVLALPPSASDSIPLVTGRITATTPGLPTVTMPVQVVQEARSDVDASLRTSRTGTVLSLSNSANTAGIADVFEWLVRDNVDKGAWFDVRALGAQSFPGEVYSGIPGDRLIGLALSAHNRFSNPADSEYDIAIDTTGDTVADYVVIVADYGLITAGETDGLLGAWVLNLTTLVGPVYLVSDPLDGSVFRLPLFASDLGMVMAPSAAIVGGPPLMRILGVDAYPLYHGGVGDFNVTDVTFNPFDPQRTTGDYAELAPKGRTSFTLTSRTPAANEVRSLGWMVASPYNESGYDQSMLLPAGR